MQEIAPGLFAKEIGEKPLVIFLHGVNVSHKAWGEELPALIRGAGYRTIVLDLPGFGQSPLIESDNLALSSVDKIASYIKSQGHKAILIGHSYGGGLAAILAHKYPELVDKLVLLAPGGFYPSPRSRGRLEWLDEKVAYRAGHAFHKGSSAFLASKRGQEFFDRFSEKRAPERGWQDGWQTENTAVAIQGLAAYDLDRKAKEIKVPVLLLWSKRDFVIFPALMRRLKKRTDWEGGEIEGSGHLFYLENPTLLASEILGWL